MYEKKLYQYLYKNTLFKIIVYNNACQRNTVEDQFSEIIITFFFCRLYFKNKEMGKEVQLNL